MDTNRVIPKITTQCRPQGESRAQEVEIGEGEEEVLEIAEEVEVAEDPTRMPAKDPPRAAADPALLQLAMGQAPLQIYYQK